jgi:hypothetical protein
MRRCVLAAGLAAAFAAGCGDGGLLGGSADGKYTILLVTFTGPGHVRDSKYYKEQTAELAGWKGLYVVHQENNSQLYWGKYGSIEAAQFNLRRAKRWGTRWRKNIYAEALVVPIPGGDPGPREWNLRHARGEWTVVVAHFYNMPPKGLIPAYTRRKEDAVASCRQLREKGEQAYFYHAAGRSYVTIGLFPADAVTGGWRQLQTADGRRQWAIAQHVRHPEMKRILNDYKQLGVNGVAAYILGKDAATQEDVRIGYETSYPMQVPRDAGDTPRDALDRAGQQQPG